jgi:hypothetical protein
VKDTADPAPVTLMMWIDHQFPEFFPVHHLLAWLYLSGIMVGFFFLTNASYAANFNALYVFYSNQIVTPFYDDELK